MRPPFHDHGENPLKRNITLLAVLLAAIDDMANFDRFNDIYREYFKTEPLPTRSTVAVKQLARGAHLELTMTAVRSKK